MTPELAALVARLRLYVKHQCNCRIYARSDPNDCTCGLTALRAELKITQDYLDTASTQSGDNFLRAERAEAERDSLRATLATQAAEIERLKLHYKGVPHDWVAQELYDDQAATIEALRKDAERYRWLREYTDARPDHVQDFRGNLLEGSDLDAAIDAALMTESKP